MEIRCTIPPLCPRFAFKIPDGPEPPLPHFQTLSTGFQRDCAGHKAQRRVLLWPHQCGMLNLSAFTHRPEA